uniref:Uncharacterized protein n=1 Tax=Rangifer tarandus platyrhynchus TaxID=3082113 RepID=A0ACB0FGU8_RANTA|nr:unnamed protein product [Rangifer tarandus platyrhynchus]
MIRGRIWSQAKARPGGQNAHRLPHQAFCAWGLCGREGQMALLNVDAAGRLVAGDTATWTAGGNTEGWASVRHGPSTFFYRSSIWLKCPYNEKTDAHDALMGWGRTPTMPSRVGEGRPRRPHGSGKDAYDTLMGWGRTPTKPRSLTAVLLSTSERAAAGPSAGVTGPEQPGQYGTGEAPPTNRGAGRAGHLAPWTAFLIGNLTDDLRSPFRTLGKCTGHSDS